MTEPMQSEVYQSPFSFRYGSAQMRRIFSPKNRYSVWRKVWTALAKAEKEAGLPITQAQIEELESHVHTIDFSKVEELEKVLKHDVMAHLEAYRIDCPLAKPILHAGATSCSITDNADMVLVREALQIIRSKVHALLKVWGEKALNYKDLACLSYTHFQAAQPTTVGKRMALWLQPFWISSQKIDDLLSSLRLLGLKGATGTQNSFLELFDGDEDKIERLEEKFVESLGFSACWPITGQTYPRFYDVEIADLLAGIAISAKKMATDLRLLAHDKEIEEPFGKSQVGSSAMPYKRNPITFENICSLARLPMEASSVAKQVAAEQWLERSLDDSAGRRTIIPESFLAIDSILDTLLHSGKNLVVYPYMIKKNLERELPFLATENILMACVKKGADRNVVHEKLRKLSQEVGDRIKNEGAENDLLQRIVQEASFQLSQEELKTIVEPKKFIGRAPKQTENFVLKEIYPYLK